MTTMTTMTSATITTAVATAATERYLTAAEVAEHLEVSLTTVTRWARTGQLPFVRALGGHRCYPEPAVHAIRSQMSEGLANVPHRRWPA